MQAKHNKKKKKVYTQLENTNLSLLLLCREMPFAYFSQTRTVSIYSDRSHIQLQMSENTKRMAKVRMFYNVYDCAATCSKPSFVILFDIDLTITQHLQVQHMQFFFRHEQKSQPGGVVRSHAVLVPSGWSGGQTVQDQIIISVHAVEAGPFPMSLIHRCAASLRVVISHWKVNLAPISSSPGGTAAHCAMKWWYPLGSLFPPLSPTFFPSADRLLHNEARLCSLTYTHTHTFPLRFFCIDLAIILF